MITLTPAANAAICKLSSEEGRRTGWFPRALRVGVRGDGCTGYQYFFEWAEVLGMPQEVVVATIDTGAVAGPICVVSDPKSQALLDGSTLDHSSGLMGTGFSWSNPRATGGCGCGRSVSF